MSDYATRRNESVEKTLDNIDAVIACMACGGRVPEDGPSDLFCSPQCHCDGLEHPSDGTSDEYAVEDDEWDPTNRRPLWSHLHELPPVQIGSIPEQMLQAAAQHLSERIRIGAVQVPTVTDDPLDRYVGYHVPPWQHAWFRRVWLNRPVQGTLGTWADPGIASPATDQGGHDGTP